MTNLYLFTVPTGNDVWLYDPTSPLPPIGTPLLRRLLLLKVG